MSYETNRQWSDGFIPAIRQIVGPHLIGVAPEVEDTQRATDLMILTARDVRIAARMRRPGYAQRFPYDFTIRSHRDDGCKTEMQKMIEGYGDWMFYGHGNYDGSSVDAFLLIDLAVWRSALIRRGYSAGWVGLASRRSNGDGTHFFVFDVREFPPEMVIASSSREIQCV